MKKGTRISQSKPESRRPRNPSQGDGCRPADVDDRRPTTDDDELVYTTSVLLLSIASGGAKFLHGTNKITKY